MAERKECGCESAYYDRKYGAGIRPYENGKCVVCGKSDEPVPAPKSESPAKVKRGR